MLKNFLASYATLFRYLLPAPNLVGRLCAYQSKKRGHSMCGHLSFPQKSPCIGQSLYTQSPAILGSFNIHRERESTGDSTPIQTLPHGLSIFISPGKSAVPLCIFKVYLLIPFTSDEHVVFSFLFLFFG